MIFHLIHYLGIDDPQGPWYAFWSGFGSDISEFAIIGAMWSIVRKHNCHHHWCPFVGRYPSIESDAWHYCKYHHSHEGEHR